MNESTSKTDKSVGGNISWKNNKGVARFGEIVDIDSEDGLYYVKLADGGNDTVEFNKVK